MTASGRNEPTACAGVCPEPADPKNPACAGICPTPPDENIPACLETMPCPNPPDLKFKKCTKKNWPPCNPAAFLSELIPMLRKQR